MLPSVCGASCKHGVSFYRCLRDSERSPSAVALYLVEPKPCAYVLGVSTSVRTSSERMYYGVDYRAIWIFPAVSRLQVWLGISSTMVNDLGYLVNHLIKSLLCQIQDAKLAKILRMSGSTVRFVGGAFVST